MDSRPPIIRAAEDSVRKYTDFEERKLAEQLHRLIEAVHSGRFRDSGMTAGGLVVNFHFKLFQGVRTHAGKVRTQDFGSETLVFGPNRSVHRDDVPAELSRIFDSTDRSIAHLRADPESHDYEEQAIRLAVWAHAELIRIHPFEDGNGRTSRLLMNAILVELGLPPAIVDIPKEEYRSSLNHYYRTREIQPLLDLVIRSYDE